jgi:hypothetical protein
MLMPYEEAQNTSKHSQYDKLPLPLFRESLSKSTKWDALT